MARIWSLDLATARRNAATSSSTLSRSTVDWTEEGSARERKYPGPMTTPPEAGIPRRTFIFDRPPSVTPVLLLSEFPADQLADGGNRLLRVGADRTHQDAGLPGGRQHQHPHDALAVDFHPVLGDPDLRGEPVGQVDELGRGARVQSQPVQDLEFPFHHPRPRLHIPFRQPFPALRRFTA